ncbi:MAG: hypothetical protein RR277_09170 [Rikenellaceae bacterium]
MVEVSLGEVYRMKLTTTEGIIPKCKNDTSRNKYFIILGKDEYGDIIGFSVINTKLNINENTQYPLSKDKYKFLNGVSRYVDCSRIKRITSKRFSELFTLDSKKGQISDEDFRFIVDTVKTSKQTTIKEIKQFNL